MERNYNTVPNQKVVKVQKAPADKSNLYSVINIEAAHNAMKDLAETKAGFMLWYYFAENQNGYEFALSSKAVEAATGIKVKAYNSAIAAMIEKGYLVNTKGNYYVFHECPVILSQDNAADENTKSVMPSQDNGYPLTAQRVMLSEDKAYPPAAQEILQYYNNNTYDNTFCATSTQSVEAPQENQQEEIKTMTYAELVALGAQGYTIDSKGIATFTTGVKRKIVFSKSNCGNDD